MSEDTYRDLAERISESFDEIDNDIVVDFRKTDEEYFALYQKIADLKENYPFIDKVKEGGGELSLTAEEHKVLTEYFRLQFRLEGMERKQLYFRGHTDCIAYLKKIGAL